MHKILKNFLIPASFTLLLSCGTTIGTTIKKTYPNLKNGDYAITFGSCNKHDQHQPLWRPIISNNSEVFIWTGDIVYSNGTTSHSNKLEEYLSIQKKRDGYVKLRKNTTIIGTWDDNDYGLNNGGIEFDLKKENQKFMLDFLDEPNDSPRRKQDGIYTSYLYDNGRVKIILLDGRYNRTAPGANGDILGEIQWNWLTNELNNSSAKVNIIVSGIQVLSKEHRFEKWAEFPKSRQRLFDLIRSSQAKGVLIISGDRHIAEISKINLKDLDYPLIDITSSGLTQVYKGFTGEPNKYRQGEVFFDLHYGMLDIKYNDTSTDVNFLIIDGENKVQLSEKISYPI